MNDLLDRLVRRKHCMNMSVWEAAKWLRSMPADTILDGHSCCAHLLTQRGSNAPTSCSPHNGLTKPVGMAGPRGAVAECSPMGEHRTEMPVVDDAKPEWADTRPDTLSHRPSPNQSVAERAPAHPHTGSPSNWKTEPEIEPEPGPYELTVGDYAVVQHTPGGEQAPPPQVLIYA